MSKDWTDLVKDFSTGVYKVKGSNHKTIYVLGKEAGKQGRTDTSDSDRELVREAYKSLKGGSYYEPGESRDKEVDDQFLAGFLDGLAERESGDGGWWSKIMDFDESDREVPAGKCAEVLFRNCHSGLVHAGASISDVKSNGAFRPVGEAGKFTSSRRYLNSATFAEAGRKSADNALQTAFLFLEYDAPAGEDEDDFKRKLDAGEITCEEARRKNLSSTCSLLSKLERKGILPTTLTATGNKSYHAAFRLKTPVDAKDFGDAVRKRLKAALQSCGLDESSADPCHSTRMPFKDGPNPIGLKSSSQRLVWLDEDAEVSLEDFVDALEEIGRTMPKKSSRTSERVGKSPLVKTVDAKTGSAKYEVDGLAMAEYVRSRGWRCYVLGESLDDRTLCRVDANGAYTAVSDPAVLVEDVFSGILDDFGLFESVKLQELCKPKMLHSRIYFPKVERAEKIRDDRDFSYFPCRNGLLKVTGKSSDLLPYDGKKVFPADSPTYGIDYVPTDEKSEYEELVERMCGKIEVWPFWKELKASGMAFIGSLVHRKNPDFQVNLIRTAVERDAGQNEGGTGKSAIFSLLACYRKLQVVPMKQESQESGRFLIGRIHPDAEILLLDDCKENEDMTFWFNASANSTVSGERKGKSEDVKWNADEFPRMCATSNHVFKGIGEAYRRRTRYLELPGHYNGGLTIADDFGHRLGKGGWSPDEMSRGLNFVVRCLQGYLASDRKVREHFTDDLRWNLLEKNVPASWRDFLLEAFNPEAEFPEVSYGCEFRIREVKAKYNKWLVCQKQADYEDCEKLRDGGVKPQEWSERKIVSYLRCFCQYLSGDAGMVSLDKRKCKLNGVSGFSYCFSRKEGGTSTLSEDPMCHQCATQCATLENAGNEPVMTMGGTSGTLKGEFVAYERTEGVCDDRTVLKGSPQPPPKVPLRHNPLATRKMQGGTLMEHGGTSEAEVPPGRRKTFTKLAEEIRDSLKDLKCDDPKAPWHLTASDEETKRDFLDQISRRAERYEKESISWPEWKIKREMEDFEKLAHELSELEKKIRH